MQDILKRLDLPLPPDAAEKLGIYNALLRKWQKAVNLVSPATLDEAPVRHFLDSAQLLRHIPDRAAVLADIGSGAGFPGLVLAVLGMQNVHLVESDGKKVEFLKCVSRETQTPVTIHHGRIETCQLPPIDILTARALAPLSDLLGFMYNIKENKQAYGLFLKGEKWEEEIRQAREVWTFAAKAHPSLTSDTGKIIEINNLTK